MEGAQSPTDFVGLNYYHGYLVRHDPDSWWATPAWKSPKPLAPR